MGRPAVSSDRVAKILNRAALGGSYNKIVEDTEDNKSLVRNVLLAFPLWDYFRTKGSEDDS